LDRFHHILISPGFEFRPSTISRQTAPILGNVLFDETRRLKICGGWWLRDGTERQARSVAQVAAEHHVPYRHVDAATRASAVEMIRTIRVRLHDDRLELVTPKQTRKIPITAIRTLDLSLTASEMDEEKSLDHSQRREQVLRGIAEAMLMGTPAGDLLVKISESRLIDPQPRLLLLGPDPQAWSIDRTTVFPDLAAQGAAQSLANLLRFSGILIGSLAAHRTTPETRALWQQGDLSGIRRDSLEEQQARIEALHAWIQDGGSLGPVTDSQ